MSKIKITLIVFLFLLLGLFIGPRLCKDNMCNRVSAHLLIGMWLNNRDHFLYCDQLPENSQVEKILSEHKEDFYRVYKEKYGKSVHPDDIGYLISDRYLLGDNLLNCPNNKDIVIHVDTSEKTKFVKETFGDDFYGVPYRLYNQFF